MYSNSEMSEEQQNIVRMRSSQLEQFSYRELEYFFSRFRAVRPVTRVLVLVVTRPQSSNLRNVIRETWAHRINWGQFYKQGAPVAMYNYPGIVERFNRDQLDFVKFEVKFVTGKCSGYESKNCDAAVELDNRHYWLSLHLLLRKVNFRNFYNNSHISCQNGPLQMEKDVGKLSK